jgi:hypothetical protein
LRRAKEMAAQLGIQYQELAKGAVAAAERTSASADLMARGLKLDKKQEEFITNLAQMKDGKMVIEVGSSKDLKEYFKGQSTVKLEELTQDQVEQLIKYQDQLKVMTDEQIVKQQASDIENMKRDVNYIAALLRIQAGRITNDAMLMGLSATTGQTMKELEKSFAEFSKNQTGPIQEIQDKFMNLVTSELKKGEDFKNNKDKKSATEDKKNESKQTSPVVNVNPKENTTKEDPNKGKVILDEAGIVIASEIAKKIDENKSKTINPTQPTQTNPNLKTNEQKDENNKFLSDFERGLSSLNKQQPQPLTFDINRENPLTVNITEESIVKLKKSEVNPSLGQLDKQNFNFSEDFYSDFEKTYGSINKDNQKSLTFDINRDKPLDVNITEESITKLVKNDIKPLLNEQKNVSTDSPNNFLSGFEKTYGSINKGNEKSVVKVSPQSIETQKNNDLQKAISEQNQKNSLVRNTDQQKPNIEENESVATVVHKHIVEMNVSSTGPIVDVLARAMLKDPTIVSQFIGRDVREFV